MTSKNFHILFSNSCLKTRSTAGRYRILRCVSVVCFFAKFVFSQCVALHAHMCVSRDLQMRLFPPPSFVWACCGLQGRAQDLSNVALVVSHMHAHIFIPLYTYTFDVHSLDRAGRQATERHLMFCMSLYVTQRLCNEFVLKLVCYVYAEFVCA